MRGGYRTLSRIRRSGGSPSVGGVAARAWWRIAPAVLALAWGGNHFSVLLLLYRREEGYSQVAVDLLLAAYVVGIVPGFLISGPLSDRFGRRPLLVAGVLIGCAGSAVLAAAPGSLAVLAVGRLVSGVSVAIAMVVGSSWIKEVSAAPWPVVAAPVAARRASLTLTAGFGLGPAVSGTIAQWGPAPTLLPYGIHVALTLLAAAPLLTAPETRGACSGVAPALAADLVEPLAVRRRFLRVVVPASPWVFGCASCAFAVVPAVVAGRTGQLGVAYASLLAVVALSVGAAVQPFAVRIGSVAGGRQLPVGLAVATLGLLLAALTAALVSPLLGVLAAAVLGAGYGLCLVSGLTEVQRTAPPEALGGLTAVYYSVTYVGFTFPVLLAAASALAPVGLLLVLLAAACLICLGASARAAAR